MDNTDRDLRLVKLYATLILMIQQHGRMVVDLMKFENEIEKKIKELADITGSPEINELLKREKFNQN